MDIFVRVRCGVVDGTVFIIVRLDLLPKAEVTGDVNPRQYSWIVSSIRPLECLRQFRHGVQISSFRHCQGKEIAVTRRWKGF